MSARVLVLVLLGCGSLLVPPVPVLSAETLYAPKSEAFIRAHMVAWAGDRGLSADQQQVLLERWDGSSSTGPEASRLLERAVAVWELGDPELAGFLEQCQTLPPQQLSTLVPMVTRTGLDPFVAVNLQACLGRTMAEQRLYDEALRQLLAVRLEEAIDPAAVLFYTAVAAQEILEIPDAITALNRLLDQTAQVPPRYATVAELMRAELDGLQSQSLDEISRLMNDSERRLDLGRAGETVQGVQDRIIAGLDELIKKLEAQGGGGGGGGSGSSNSNQSSSPADDSRVKGATAPGETDSKKFSKAGNWGDLPEKAQADAKNLINREFPSHYRQAIESYFKKLAGRPAGAGD